MKVLFITPQLPYPPQKGTIARNFNIIKNLAAKNDIHLLSFGDPGDREAITALGQICREIRVCVPPDRSTLSRVRDLFFDSKPDLSVRLASPDFARELARLLSDNYFDVLQIEGLEMSLYWKMISDSNNQSRPSIKAVVYDEHNAEYVLQRRAFEIDRTKPTRWIGAFYSFVQWQKLVRYETNICHIVDAVLTVSETDADALKSIASPTRLAIVPNGVDVEYFRWPEAGNDDAIALLFTGTMDFRPNIDAVIWFCEEILPRVQGEIPGLTFYIVGRAPSPRIRELGKMPGVVVTGLVDDVRPYFRKAAVYVVPMRFGGGTRFKVLEAMASGVPVVSTTMGAEGIEGKHGEHLIIADEPDAFARWIVRLLREKDFRQRIAENARVVVERKYDWRIIAPRLEELYAQIVRPC